MTIQTHLYNLILESSKIDEIQSRYIAYELEQKGVKDIQTISTKDNTVYIIQTDRGTYRVKPLNLPIPATSIKKIS